MKDAASLLPLSRSLVHLLLALHEGERYGYAVKKRVERLGAFIDHARTALSSASGR
ncbi:MAG: hypothetical protein IH968_13390 [Gemmatimonadetes bacterium]|nr:hypothetical protein [Gemmatimonadota bacterium]